MARNDGGADPEGRRVTNYQSALLDRLAGLDPHEVEKGLNMSEAMSPDPLSERVRKYVVEVSGGLAEVHRRTGLPKMTLSGWLRGEKHITTGNFDRICEAYGIEVFRWLGEPSENVPSAVQLGELGETERAKIEVLLAEHKQKSNDFKMKTLADIEALRREVQDSLIKNIESLGSSLKSRTAKG